jgi:aminopeptidase YwaD
MRRLVVIAAAGALAAVGTAAGGGALAAVGTAAAGGALAAVGTAATAGAVAQAPAPTPYAATLHVTRDIGPRPAGSPGELRAQRYAAARFRAAGLRVGYERFAVPGHGRSRTVVGALDTPARCLTILMAHADTGPAGPGANDDASGVGVVVALAGRLASASAKPPCDVWLAVTGAEERGFTGQADHLGAAALVRRVNRLGRRGDLRIALSLDDVGRGGRFFLQSPHPRARGAVEGRVLTAAREANARVRFAADAATGNSDHREFELSGLPGAKLGPWNGAEPCRELACDTWQRLDRATLNRAFAIADGVARAG